MIHYFFFICVNFFSLLLFSVVHISFSSNYYNHGTFRFYILLIIILLFFHCFKSSVYSLSCAQTLRGFQTCIPPGLYVFIFPLLKGPLTDCISLIHFKLQDTLSYRKLLINSLNCSLSQHLKIHFNFLLGINIVFSSKLLYLRDIIYIHKIFPHPKL